MLWRLPSCPARKEVLLEGRDWTILEDGWRVYRASKEYKMPSPTILKKDGCSRLQLRKCNFEKVMPFPLISADETKIVTTQLSCSSLNWD
jgi:hypothetical protein